MAKDTTTHEAETRHGGYDGNKKQKQEVMNMEIAIYETYDYHTKSWYWWTGRDKSTNCFEIRKSGKKFNLIVNEIFDSSYETLESAFAKLKFMYDNGKTEKKFRIIRK